MSLDILNQEPFRFLLSFGVIIFLVLNLAAVLTFAERKVSAYIQLRYGPNRVGPRGILQPAADVFKLFTKENVHPGRADLWIFLAAPIAMFLPAAAVWLVIPFAPDLVVARSEEHTSELQSRQYLVCRLLLEKKNTNYNIPLSRPSFIPFYAMTYILRT